MLPFLAFVTTLLNLVGLAVSLCLGLYIVTRTPRSRLSWLAALTLWSASGFFLHNAMAIHVPGSGVLPWLRPVVMLALPLSFHLILLLPPAREPSALDFYLPPLHPDAARLSKVSRAAVPLAYGLAVALTIGGVFPGGDLPIEATDPVVFLSDQSGGPLHLLALVYVALLGGLAFWHLWLGRKEASSSRERRTYTPLFVAVALTCLGGAYLGLGISFGLPLPSFPGDVAVGLAAFVVGYVVARHNALSEGTDVNRDLRYVALVIGSFTLLYVAMAEVLYLGGHIFSPLTLILIIIVAVSSLMLYDGLRNTVDRLFYREQFQQLRANLRALAREAGVGLSLPERLQAILGALCRTRHIQRGLITLRRGETYVCAASERAAPVGCAFAAGVLSAEEIVELPETAGEGLEDMVLLAPIYDGEVQIGALVLGAKESGEPYGEDDLLLLDDLAEQLATMIREIQLQEENAQAISEMVAEFRQREHNLQRQMQQLLAEREAAPHPVLAGIGEKEFVSLVEDALRRLHDYPYLGEQPLAQLQVVDWHLRGSEAEFLTHLDRGKALSDVLVRALNKLKPDGPEPERHTIPAREWHQFTILHDAYVLGELNRDILARLYVGEGTFNRTRRRALRGVAKALQEMERETHQRIGKIDRY